MYSVVLTEEPPGPYVRARLSGRVHVSVVKSDESDLEVLLATADALLVRLFRVTEGVLAKAPRLKVIGRHGVGVDTVDVTAATRRRIPVVYTPAANSDSVAEHCVLLMLAVARRLLEKERAARAFHWERTGLGFELREKTLGLIGVGQVGRRVARICRAGLGMTVIGFDPLLAPRDFPADAIRVAALAELLGRADVISLHAPLSGETRHLLNAERLSKMKPGAIVINTSRGGLVDERALAAALRDGRLAGAGLDVMEDEPPHPDNPLLALAESRLVLTPHAASLTSDALAKMAEMVCDGMLAVLDGRQPANVVNPEVWSPSD